MEGSKEQDVRLRLVLIALFNWHVFLPIWSLLEDLLCSIIRYPRWLGALLLVLSSLLSPNHMTITLLKRVETNDIPSNEASS